MSGAILQGLSRNPLA
ncbi:hypothetical protein ACT4UM_14005, partial [Bacillus sp. SS-TM]